MEPQPTATLPEEGQANKSDADTCEVEDDISDMPLDLSIRCKDPDNLSPSSKEGPVTAVLTSASSSPIKEKAEKHINVSPTAIPKNSSPVGSGIKMMTLNDISKAITGIGTKKILTLNTEKEKDNCEKPSISSDTSPTLKGKDKQTTVEKQQGSKVTPDIKKPISTSAPPSTTTIEKKQVSKVTPDIKKPVSPSAPSSTITIKKEQVSKVTPDNKKPISTPTPSSTITIKKEQVSKVTPDIKKPISTSAPPSTTTIEKKQVSKVTPDIKKPVSPSAPSSTITIKKQQASKVTPDFKKPMSTPTPSSTNQVGKQRVSRVSPDKKMPVLVTPSPTTAIGNFGKQRVSRVTSDKKMPVLVTPFTPTPKIEKVKVQAVPIQLKKLRDDHDKKPKPSSSKPLPVPKLEQGDEVEEVFSWRKFLMANPNHDMLPVPLDAFSGVPLQENWDQFATLDLKVEFQVDSNVETERGTKYSKIYWIGTIRKYFGYLAKVEDEGYPDAFHEIPYQWLNFITDCLPVGYCSALADGGLVPPLKITKSEKNWRETILNRLAGRVTIHDLVAETFKQEQVSGFKIGLKLEALDYTNTSQMKEGIVTDMKGSRICVRYWDSDGAGPDLGLWCDIRSSLMVPPGWCKAVGHAISASEGYKPKALPDDFFDQEEEIDEDEGNGMKGPVDIEVGMKCEVIFPMSPNSIVQAVVVAVLKFGYMMLAPDSLSIGPKPVPSKGLFKQFSACFHISSPQIFPCGFTQKLGIELLRPTKLESTKRTSANPIESKPLPITRSSEPCPPGFAVGLKLEAVDLSNPSIIRLATVSKIKGPLLRIGFDGFHESFDQWMHYESFDLYPVGWCDTFKYQLLGPNKDSKFWRKYKHQSLYIARGSTETTRRNASCRVLKEPLSQSADAEKKGLKRKADDIFETAVFNSYMMKEDAVKLGSKIKVLRKSTVEEVRNSLKKPISPSLTRLDVKGKTE